MTFKENNSSGVVVTTAVAAPVAATNDVEEQNKAANAAATSRQNPTNNVDGFDPEAGKTLGIAMFVLLLVALACTFFIPIVSFVALIATIVLASCITCNCCCASDLRLHPKRKKFATATLVSLCMMFIVQIIWVIAVATAVGTEEEYYDDDENEYYDDEKYYDDSQSSAESEYRVAVTTSASEFWWHITIEPRT